MAEIIIKTVQFKRGLEANLIAKLKDGAGCLGVPKEGEPIYATDSKILKIGDGVTDYEHLDPISGGDRFIIHDPLADQVLVYDPTEAGGKGAWVNRDVDEVGAFSYYLERAENAMEQAQAAAGTASSKAVDASSSAADAALSASQAAQAETAVINFVNHKFWWGTLSEYNNLDHIDDGVFYFITAEE